jgi:hypothetical protein
VTGEQWRQRLTGRDRRFAERDAREPRAVEGGSDGASRESAVERRHARVEEQVVESRRQLWVYAIGCSNLQVAKRSIREGVIADVGALALTVIRADRPLDPIGEPGRLRAGRP